MKTEWTSLPKGSGKNTIYYGYIIGSRCVLIDVLSPLSGIQCIVRLQLAYNSKKPLSNYYHYFFLQKAIERGAKGVREPWEESDEHGTVVFATVKTVSFFNSR